MMTDENGVYRPPYKDELLYGWLASIDYMNGDRPEAVLNVDVIHDMDEGLTVMGLFGRKVPSVRDAVCNNTIQYVQGISNTKGGQARYIETYLRPVRKNVMDMPSVPGRIGTWQGKGALFCPECYKEDLRSGEPYLRTWHQFPCIGTCAVHGVNLELLPPEKMCDFVFGRLKMPESVPANESSLMFAGYAKAIYDDPCPVDTDIVKSILRRDGPFSLSTGSFGNAGIEVMRSLMERFPSWQNFRAEAEPFIKTEEGEIHELIDGRFATGDPYDYVMEFTCSSCGHTWHSHPEAIRIGFGCPCCDGRMTPEERIGKILSGMGDGKYHLTGPFLGMGATQEVRHDTCGKVKRVRMAAKIWNGTLCDCERRWTPATLQGEIDRIADGFTVEDYEKNVMKVTLGHECGGSFTISLQQFRESPYCRVCAQMAHSEEVVKKEIEESGEYALVRYDGWAKGAVIRHNRCGMLMIARVGEFRKGKRCTLCTPYLLKNRDEMTYSAHSDLWITMSEWFKTHSVWVLRRHPETAVAESGALIQPLINMHLIHQVSFGIYSDRENVDIKDILTEAYLLGDDGKIHGRFSDRTEEYLTYRYGKPAMLSLTTELVAPQSHRVVEVCGEHVRIKGVNRMIPVYTKIAKDEDFTSWVLYVASMNGMTFYEFAKTYLGYTPYTNEPPFVHFLDRICQENGEEFPDILEVLEKHTDLVASVPLMTSGALALKSEALLHGSDEGFGVYNNVKRRQTFCYCPECLKTDMKMHGRPVAHVPHQMSGKACWYHRCKLITEPDVEAVPEEADLEDVWDAEYLNALYCTHHSAPYEMLHEPILSLSKRMFDLEDGKRKFEAAGFDAYHRITHVTEAVMKRPITTSGIARIQRVLSNSFPGVTLLFGRDIEGPEEYEPDYVRTFHGITYIGNVGPFHKCSCERCGHIFVRHVKSLERGMKCPVCDRTEDP